jgi:acetyl-CoA acetyltransferase
VPRALAAGLDVEAEGLADYVLGGPSSRNGTIFMDIYAREAQAYLERSGATREDFARVAAKSRAHGALNARAQFRRPVSVKHVLDDRRISGPLTLSMCSRSPTAPPRSSSPANAGPAGTHPAHLG